MTDEANPDENVVYLPDRSSRPPSTTSAPAELDSTEVVEAELVDPAEDAEIDRRLQSQGMLAVRENSARGAVTLVHRARESDAPAQVGKGLVRHSVYVATGAGVVARRWWEAHSNSRYERMMRAAEAAGDYESVAEWEERENRARRDRHSRAMDWLKAPVELAKAIAVGAASLAGLLLAVGIMLAISDGDAGLVLAPIGAVIDAVRWTWWFLFAYGTLLATLALAVLLFGLWDQGRRHGQVPVWARSIAEDVADSADTVDEGSILGALRHLGLSDLNDAFKQGWGSPGHPARVWEVGLGRDGKGWRCQLRLPQAVPVSEINRKREKLAHNLGRFPVEVWPSTPRDKPGVLDLWIADPGVLTGPVDPWPLLADLDNAHTDYFAGVPVGTTLKGEQVDGQLAGANWAAAGMMGSGKSTMVITGLLGALLDPLVEADVFVMAQNADYELMRPRLRTLCTGSGDDTVEACMANLRALYDELEVRGKALAEHTQAGDPDAEKVTRRLAEKDVRLRPRIMIVDECQALFMNETHGAEAERLAILLMSASRKYAITLKFLTPEPSSDSLPRKLMAVMSNKACFAIGDQQSNDAVLGTSSYKRGISAVGLEPKTPESNGDVGTAMTSAGFLAKPGLLRCYNVPRDKHEAVIKRAMALREGMASTPAAAAPAERDLLEDVADVLGDEPAHAAQVADALKAAHPRWQPYQTLIGKRLVTRLAEEYGVKVPSTGNKYPIDPHTVRSRLAEIATTDLDDENGVS